jgi:hypothetical protein
LFGESGVVDQADLVQATKYAIGYVFLDASFQ